MERFGDTITVINIHTSIKAGNAMSGRAKLAVDIGGTFTDLVLEKDGTRHQD